MSKLWRVARNEYRRHVFRKGFLVALLSLPLLIAVAAVVAGLLSLLDRTSQNIPAVGYVDLAGTLAAPILVYTDSDSTDTLHLVPFATEEAASAALASGQIEAYFVVANDYQETRQVTLVTLEEPAGSVVRGFRVFLQTNLLASLPTDVSQRAITGSHPILRSPDGRLEFTGKLTPDHFLLPLAGLLFVIVIFISSGYLTQAVVEERANRTMEILVTSLSPRQLVAGKLLGIVAVTATLVVSWLAFATAAAFVGGQVFDVEWLQGIRLDPGAILLLVGLLGPAYLMMAALMLTAGIALADVRGNQQVVALFISLYLVPLGLLVPVIGNPNSFLAIALSLFPLTAPVMLPLRFALVPVPFWQIVASVALQSLLALGALWIAVRTFRLGMLRFGQGLRWRELLGLTRAQSREFQKVRAPAEPREGGTVDEVATPAHTRGEITTKPMRRRAHKTLLVLRHELVTALSRPMYLLMMVGLPLLVYGQVLVVQALEPGRSAPPPEQGSPTELAGLPAIPEPEVQGYVDHSGLIRTIPEEIPAGMLVAFADEARARQALADGEIAALHVIPVDYVATGELVTVRPDVNPLAPGQPPGWIDWVLLVNLVSGDTALADQIWNPMDLQQVRAPLAADAPPADEDDLFYLLMTRWLPSLIMLLLYGVIALAAGMLLASVSDEKKNRVMEILLVSVTTRQMLAGKIIALGIAGLLQAMVWGGLGYLLLGVVGTGARLPSGIELPPSLFVWGVVFLLLGYAVYASLMAGAGALIPNVKESPFVTLLFYVPAFIGFEISLFSLENAHGFLSTAASLFPLTAPFSMMHRLVVGGVPPWQLFLSVGLMLVTIPLIVHAVSRMFRGQVLLSGQPFTVQRYFRVLLGRTL